MRLVENLRKAEKKGATAIRCGMERAREEWADVERLLRQRMRVYPQKPAAVAAAVPHSGAALIDPDETTEERQNEAAREPIISVHGHDVND